MGQYPLRSEMISTVVEDLRIKLITGEIPQGSALSEIELSVQYNISRGSVRTALQFLEQEGLIETQKNGRKISIGLSAKDVGDIWDLRLHLEYQAIKTIIDNPQADYSQIAQAILLISQYQKASDQQDIDESISTDMQIHRAIVMASENKPLIHTWESFAPIQTALLKLNANDWYAEEYNISFWERHSAILVGIMQKEKKTLDIIEEHINRGRDICIDTIRQIQKKELIITEKDLKQPLQVQMA